MAVEKNYPMFSNPMRHDQFLSALRGGEAAPLRTRCYGRPEGQRRRPAGSS
jgi:hypothetical protein